MKQEQPSKPKRLIFWLALAFLLSWILLWGGYSFLKVWKINREVGRLQQELAVMKAENDSLARENNRLKTDPAAAEEIAREQFGMIKQNETVWRFKKTPAPAKK